MPMIDVPLSPCCPVASDSRIRWLPAGIGRLATLVVLLFAAAPVLRADSVVVFNEIMYHPGTNAAGDEWLELHNQMAVDVDLSGWSIANGVAYTFPEGTVIPGDGYVVIAASPGGLSAATGLTNILGPYTGQLSNSGEKLVLYNRNQRLMDSVKYGDNADWPVGPDGSGVSLAKRDEDSASGPALNWTVSALVGGSPGRRNFPTTPFEVTNSTPVLLNSSWKYDASGTDLGSAWREPTFDDSGWSNAPAPFRGRHLGGNPGRPGVFADRFQHWRRTGRNCPGAGLRRPALLADSLGPKHTAAAGHTGHGDPESPGLGGE